MKSILKNRLLILSGFIFLSLSLSGCKNTTDQAPTILPTSKGECPDINGTFLANSSDAYFDLVGDTMLINHMENLSYTVKVLLDSDKAFIVQPNAVAPLPLPDQIADSDYMVTVRATITEYHCADGYLQLTSKFHSYNSRRDKTISSKERIYAFARSPNDELVIKITHYDWDSFSVWGDSSINLPWTRKSFTTYTQWPLEAPHSALVNSVKPASGQDLIQKILKIMPQGTSVAKKSSRDNAQLVSFRWDWRYKLNDDDFVGLEQQLLENFGLTVANKEQGALSQEVDILIPN